MTTNKYVLFLSMFCPCTIAIIFYFVHELLGFLFFFFYLCDVSSALLSPAANIVDIIEREEGR